MRSNEVYLRHIFDEVNFLMERTEALTFETFVKDETLKRASARSFEIIGEAVKNLSPEFRKKHESIDWKKLAGFRDKIIHHYFGVNWPIVWDAIKETLPGLKAKIENLLRQCASE